MTSLHDRSETAQPSPTTVPTIEGMRMRTGLEDVTAAQLTARLRNAFARSEPFDADVVFELALRAETGERLQRQVAQDALRNIAPPNGYVAGDF